MDHCHPLRSSRGFSLIQLMVALAIVGTLTGIGIPSYRYITNTSRIAGEINNLLGDMQFARFQAIKQGQTITICSAASPYTGCQTGAATTWNNGWIVFDDVNGNGTVDTGESIIRVQQAFTGSDTLTGTLGAVTFNREGFPVALAAAMVATLHSSPTNALWTRCLRVGINGQVMTGKVSTSAWCT
jgi:type IV fimbrial biogenesis protein FimT